MKKLNSRKLKNIHNIVSRYNEDNSSIVYDIPSLMKYCIENDIKVLVKEEIKKINDELINNVFNSMDLNINLQQLKSNNNSVRINISFNNNFDDFCNSYLAS
jgi:hypothetical protein